MSRINVRSWSLLLVVGFALQARADTCPTTSGPTSWSGTILDSDTTKSGTSFVPTGSPRLELTRAGGIFKAAQLATPGNVMYAAPADFNMDGFTDFIGATENASPDYLDLFTNFTWQNENCTTAACTTYAGAAPDWTDPNLVVTPKFTQGTNLHAKYISSTTAITPTGRYSLAAGDFNGDGWPDLFEGIASSSASYVVGTFNMYLNAAANDGTGAATFKARYNAAAAGFDPSTIMGQQLWSAGNTQAVDYNKDGKLDVLIGTGDSGGSIRVILNNCPGTMLPGGVFKCSTSPTFVDGGYLIKNLSTVGSTLDGFGTNTSGGTPAYAYGDVNADGRADLVVGAPNCCSTAAKRLRLFLGCASGMGCTNGLETVASQSLPFVGAATDVFMADFSLDGRVDIIVATDNFNYNSGNGGSTYYFVNNSTSTPFTAASTQLTAHSATITDYDLGFLFDYDNDPTHSMDVMIADGNDASKYYVLANRVSPQYVACGEAFSGTIDLGGLADSELVVTAARVTPQMTVPSGTTVTISMTNEAPPLWVQANLCTGSTSDYCVTFPHASGREVRWKIDMCSNSSHTVTPTITSMTAKFDYTQALEHYRSGAIVSDGVTYLGAFRQPGDRGRFYATNAGLTTTYWEAATKLDATADSSRNVYTAVAGNTKIAFESASASNAQLRALMGTTDTANTKAVIDWVRTPRFGLGNSSTPLTKLGSVLSSTPALLSAPARPNWYSFLNPTDRAKVESFITSNQTRVPLVLFGSKDGMVHALYTRPTDVTNAINGQEAWAYVPPSIASQFLANYSASASANASATDGLNHSVATAFPDGSPTLVDVKSGTTYKTIAIVGEGNGGNSITAFDVTNTVSPTTGTVSGPGPLWSATPGGSGAGRGFSKPAVARVLISGVERYLAIAGTGELGTDTTTGRVVAAYDVLTGALLWQFQAKCSVLTDITVFETDDALESGGPQLDGYIDRAVFADACGYVYKVAPNADRAGGWLPNVGLGTMNVGLAPDGTTKQYALFYTKTSSGGLGAERPIAGTLAARTDSSTRMVLFFGTGGLETQSTAQQNGFFAIYADSGAVRSKYLGACASGRCEKFYGGTVVTPEQVIFTTTYDPLVGTGTCDVGATNVNAMQLQPSPDTSFVVDFVQSVGSAVMGSLYGDAGAIYFATMNGDIGRIGTPRVANAGGDTASGYVQATGAGDPATNKTGTKNPFVLMGWRVVL